MPTGKDLYVFSGWLLQNRPDLLQNKAGTFYQDLKSDLDGLWSE